MEVLKGEDDLCSVEPGVSLAEREPVNTMLGIMSHCRNINEYKDQGPCQGICNEPSRRVHLRVVLYVFRDLPEATDLSQM